MTNKLKETLQETLTQLNRRTGDFGEFAFKDYIHNTNEALRILVHGALNYLDEKEQIEDILKCIKNTGTTNYKCNGESHEEEEPTKQPITADKDDTAELSDAGLAILHKGETILNKKQYDELKDQTINVTVNIEYDKALENLKELGLRVSKVVEEVLKKSKELQ